MLVGNKIVLPGEINRTTEWNYKWNEFKKSELDSESSENESESSPKTQSITCDLCDEIFDKKFELSRHKFYVHNVDMNNESVDGKEQGLIDFFYVYYPAESDELSKIGIRPWIFFFGIF